LRAYSRAAAIEYQLKVSGAVSAAILSAFAGAMFSAIKRIPTPVLWCGAILMLLALAHPASRKKIVEVGSRLLEGGVLAIDAGMKAIEPMLQEHAAAQQSAQAHLIRARTQLSC
jgi:hypothetical protein